MFMSLAQSDYYKVTLLMKINYLVIINRRFFELFTHKIMIQQFFATNLTFVTYY